MFEQSQQNKIRATVLGAKYFNDTVDGKPYNSTTLFVALPLDESRGTAKGFAVTEMKWGDSTNFERIKSLKFPLAGDMVVEDVTSGKATKRVCVDFRPDIGQHNPATKQAAAAGA